MKSMLSRGYLDTCYTFWKFLCLIFENSRDITLADVRFGTFQLLAYIPKLLSKLCLNGEVLNFLWIHEL